MSTCKSIIAAIKRIRSINSCLISNRQHNNQPQEELTLGKV